jgi:pimeloyl-ACP methyl ester carboxylesterase
MRVTVDDAAIDVATDGKGDAIVLIHGFPLTREIWDQQAAELSKRSLVIRPDLRGMGRSSVPDGPYLMETLAGDVAAVLDAMGIERAALVGHSLGGYVAMAFCRMYTERVTKLALVCSRLAADSQEMAKNRAELADRTERDGRIDPIVDAYLPRLFASETLQNRAPAVDRAREIASRIDPRGGAAMLRGMAQRVDSYDIAEELSMPVLIVAGGGDQVVPPAEAEEMRRAFPYAALKTLGRSGHLPMLEEPGALAEILCEFASGTAPAAPDGLGETDL